MELETESKRIKNIEMFLFSGSIVTLLLISIVNLAKQRSTYTLIGMYLASIIIIVFSFIAGLTYLLAMFYLYKMINTGMLQLIISLDTNMPKFIKIATPILSIIKFILKTGLVLSIPFVYYQTYMQGPQIFWPSLIPLVLVIARYVFFKKKK